MTSAVKPSLGVVGERPTAPASRTLATPSFDRAYADCFDMVWHGLRRLGVAEAHLDDAAQDVFLKVHCHLHDFEGRSTLRSWVFGIAVNVAREHRRKHRGRRQMDPLPDTAPPDPRADPSDVVACREALELLDRLLDELDDDRRAVLVLAEWEELSAPEIAASLHVNVNTVYSRLRAARTDFEAALARHQRRSR
jgi:RNA polymerase sigma-70 factor (ECF subfamily)